MNDIIVECFQYGMEIAGAFGIVGFLVGLCMNLFENFGRG